MKYEFIRMPDSTGFGDYTESGQVIPVSFNGRHGSYTHCMFLDDESALRAVASSGGSQETRAHRSRSKRTRLSERSTTVRCAWPPARWLQASRLDTSEMKLAMGSPNFLIKVIPHVEAQRESATRRVPAGGYRRPRAGRGPGSLQLNPHALARVASYRTRDRIGGSILAV